MGFKVGDSVKVINNVGGHYFLYQVGVVIQIRYDLPLPVLVDFHEGVGRMGHEWDYGGRHGGAKNGWWFYDEELTIDEEHIVTKILTKYGEV